MTNLAMISTMVLSTQPPRSQKGLAEVDVDLAMNTMISRGIRIEQYQNAPSATLRIAQRMISILKANNNKRENTLFITPTGGILILLSGKMPKPSKNSGNKSLST